MSETLQHIVDHTIADAAASCVPFAPELVLSGAIVLILVGRMAAPRIDSWWIALAAAGAALLVAWPGQSLSGLAAAGSVMRFSAFTGMLAYDGFALFARGAILLSVLLLVIFMRTSGVPDREAGPDVYVLVLGATVGMCVMATADHLLAMFLGVEMASVPSYVLAGLVKGRRRASEAALKFAVYGAGAAGVMLYGGSLLAGLLDSAHFPTMAQRLAALLTGDEATAAVRATLALAALCLVVGLAFKLSAVPFHFWAPDVFEGATAEVNAFLSVASKTAALALLARIALVVCYAPVERPVAPHDVARAASSAGEPVPAASASLSSSPPAALTLRPIGPTARALAPARDFLGGLLAVIAAVTCTFGNLAAYGQTNIKRLLAYSTIAHAGYLMMPIAAALLLVDKDPAAAESAIAALALYIAAYLFMNTGAFAVVALVRNALGSETIDDYAGLVGRAPTLAISMTILLLSLVGLPPLAGFLAKFFVFAALYDAGLFSLLVIAGLNTALSVFYYFRIVRLMTFGGAGEHARPLDVSRGQTAFVVLVTAPVIWWGIWGKNLIEVTQAAARNLF